MGVSRIRPLALAGLALAAALAWGAPPGAPAATRAELERWFVELRADRALAVDAPLRWVYSFTAMDGRSLEALSLALVAEGYAIARLGRAAHDAAAVLDVARLELHTPLTLERRQRGLNALAERHGARYAGVDAGPRL